MGDKITQFKGTIYENGYGLIAKKVMKDSNLSLGAKGLYAYICAYAGNDSKAFPSRELIIYELNISKDTFNRYKNELEESGYIEIVKVKSNTGQFKNNVYEISNNPCPKKPDTDMPDTVKPDTENKDTTNNNLTSNNSTKNNSTKNKCVYADNVQMKEEEYKTLVNKYGLDKTNRMIEVLDNYKGASGKKYQSDYKAILTWVVDKVEEEFRKKQNSGQPKPQLPKQVPNQGEKRQYDVDDLEKQLLGRG